MDSNNQSQNFYTRTGFRHLPTRRRLNSETDWLSSPHQLKNRSRNSSLIKSVIDDSVSKSYLRISDGEPKQYGSNQILDDDANNKLLTMLKFCASPVSVPSVRFYAPLTEDMLLGKRPDMENDDNYADEMAARRLEELDFDEPSLFQRPDKKSLRDDMSIIQLQRFKSNESCGGVANGIGSGIGSIYNMLDNSMVIDLPQENRGLDYPHFGKLLNLLKKHFKGLRIDEKDMMLSKYELEVLKSILARKYKDQVNTEITSVFLKEKLDEIDNLESNKRPEENYKFIFKRCIKFMKERLKVFENKKMKKKEFDDFFYTYYFSELCTRSNLKMDQFRHPQYTKKASKAPKTVNMEYMFNTLKSEKFNRDFVEYLKNYLKVDYEFTIDSKIEGLVKKWDKQFAAAESKETVVKEIVTYVLKNTKCKLPWTIKEIEIALSAVNNLIAAYVIN